MSRIDPEAKMEKLEKAKGVRITDAELSICFKIYRHAMREGGEGAKAAYLQAGTLIGRDWKVVERAIKRILPTTDLAKAVMQAGAVKLAKRIVSKASPSEAIDVLSRSDMGVIAPKQESESGGGFFISIQAQDCGAVNVAAVEGKPKAKALPNSSVVVDV